MSFLNKYPVSLLFLLYSFLGNPIMVHAQATSVCVSDEFLANKRKDSSFLLQEKKTNAAIRDIILSGDQVFSTMTLYTIPVVFHIITANPKSITDKMVADALKDLNDAFAHRSPYDGDPGGVDTKIQFCLARTRPDGGITSGIDRATTYYGQHDMDMEGDKPSSLMDWDRSKYINIWVVDAIQAEIMQKFTCGTWSRMGVGGYAGAGSGLVVAGLGGPLLAHEMGHYLSLLHTFAAMDCKNTDCTTDGDLVCDTPPDASTAASPCNNPENSCNTDVLSGPFKNDTTDNISNFMDYGSPCPSVFTQGQADRMRAFLQVFNSGSLLTSDKCSVPCSENIYAAFDWDTNPFPKVGDNVTFNNTSLGASSYKWYLNNILVGTTPNITLNFPNQGKQTVKLIAYNANQNCFSSYEGNIYVNCGVDARFSPAIRLIAADDIIYPDSVFFWNKSYGADAYQWFITDPTGLNYA
ncbi:MAG: M43 family zinc metalloprotease, partial [Bacteroidota bacterium]